MRQAQKVDREDIPFSKSIREWRWAAGMTIDDAAYVAKQLLPTGMSISRETVRRLESNEVAEEDVDPLNLQAISVAYGRHSKEASQIQAQRAKQVQDLFSGRRKWPPARQGS
jgi:hypothetical protein